MLHSGQMIVITQPHDTFIQGQFCEPDKEFHVMVQWQSRAKATNQWGIKEEEQEPNRMLHMC